MSFTDKTRALHEVGPGHSPAAPKLKRIDGEQNGNERNLLFCLRYRQPLGKAAVASVRHQAANRACAKEMLCHTAKDPLTEAAVAISTGHN